MTTTDDRYHTFTIPTSAPPKRGTWTGQPVAFPEGMPAPPAPYAPATPLSTSSPIATVKKLKKTRKGTEDGYESDGGYLSEGGRKQKDKKKKAKVLKEGKLNLDTNSLENGGLAVPEERKRKKSLVDAVKGSMKKKDKETDVGYLTDGPSSKPKKSKLKSKSPKNKVSEDALYETDGGTKRSKTRMFFKMSGKSSKPDMRESSREEERLPKEQVPLPIADRFATLSPTSGSAASVSGDSQVSLPAVPPASSTYAAIGDTRSNGNTLPSLSFQPFTAGADMSALSSRPQTPPLSTPLSHSSSLVSRPTASFQTLSQPTGPSRDSQSSSSSGGSMSQSRASAISSHNIPQLSSSLTSFATSHSHSQLPSPHGGHGLGMGSGSTVTYFSRHGHGQTIKMDIPPPNAPSSLTSSRPVSSPSSAPYETFKPPMISFEIAQDVSTVPLMMIQRQSQTESETDAQSWVQVETASLEDMETTPYAASASSPPVVPVNVGKGGGFGLRLRPSLEKINLLGLRREALSPGSAMPSPISPASAMAPLKSPQSAPLSSPAVQHGFSHSPLRLSSRLSRQGRSKSPAENSSSVVQMPPHALISPPNSAVSPSALSPSLTFDAVAPWNSRPSHLTLSLRPGHQFGPRGLGNGSPSALAYYDIPPPSPPPTGPLPLPPLMKGDEISTTKNRSPSPWRRSRNSIPPLPVNDANANPPTMPFPTPSQLRQRVLDRSPRTLPPDDIVRGATAGHSVAALNIRRGKDSPFPSRPMSPRRNEVDSLVVGKKYRDISPPSSSSSHRAPGDLWGRDASIPPVHAEDRKDSLSSWVEFESRSGKRTNESSEELEDENDPSDDDRLRDSFDTNRLSSDSAINSILNRFVNNPSRSEEYEPFGKAFARKRSSEALNHAWDDGKTVGDRTSRWSGSIYSRASLLDEEESNVARDRFVKQVEAMLAAEATRVNSEIIDDVAPAVDRGRSGIGRGRGRDEYIPPVPKIPDAFASPEKVIPAGRTWNRF